MKILMICFNMVGHGTYLRAYEFARCLIARNHKATLMAVSPQQKFGIRIRNENGIEIVETPDIFRGPLRSGWDPLNVLTRLHWLRKQEYDLVHSYEARPICIYPARYSQNRGVPMLLDWSDWLGHGGSVEQRPNPLIRMILRPVETYFENTYRAGADGNTVICTTLYNRALGLGVNRKRLSLIPNGFNLPGWKSFSIKNARQALGISDKYFLIGYVGSLFPGDARLMSQALSHLKEKIPELRLLHIGRSNYRLPSQTAVIYTRVIDQDKLSQYLAACDVCWLPFEDTNANRGRFPLKFSNYLAAGKPIVATNVGDVAELVCEESVGLTCQPTPSELASSVCQIYENLDARMEFSHNSEQVSKDPRYSWSTRTDRLLTLYRQVTNT